MRSPDQIRQLLGLSPDDSLTQDALVPAPATGVGHGLASVTVQPEISPQIIEAILRQPRFNPDPDLNRKLGLESVARWDGDLRVVVFDALVTASAGASAFVPELGWLVDTRGADAAVIIEDPHSHEARYLSAENGDIAIGRVTFEAKPSPAFVFQDPPTLQLPDLESLLLNLGVKSWLQEEIRQRSASTSVLVRAAAVGLTGRLAMGELEEPERLFHSVVSGGPDPFDVLRTWARDLPHEVVTYLESSALEEAGTLGDEIDGLDRLVSQDDLEVVRSALSCRRRRDDLESVAYVLKAQIDTILLDTLQALDRRATAQLSTFDFATDPDAEPPLFGAVSAAQPGAWWGTVWSD